MVTQLAFNVGFYMVLPYLSVYLADDLGLTAGVVGLALGLRTRRGPAPPTHPGPC